MHNGLHSVDTLPPHIMLYIFESLIKPITVYVSEVWGYNKTTQPETDEFSSDLQDKFCESNQPWIIIIGECGIMPPGTIYYLHVVLSK